jgi:integrase
VEQIFSLTEALLSDNLRSATPPKRVGRKGPVPQRRHQEGTFREENGFYYAFFYQDRKTPDGKTRSVKTRFKLGKVAEMSERAAQREFDRLRQQINKDRGSTRPIPKGETFADAANLYMETISPNKGIATHRQRKSHLRKHLMPRFGKEQLTALDYLALQRLVTDMGRITDTGRKNKSKTIKNVLGTFAKILDFARLRGAPVPEIALKNLEIPDDKDELEMPQFPPATSMRIIARAQEPYKTIFSIAAIAGLRAGELLGLRRPDIDFKRMQIRPGKQADDATRQLRELKTKASKAPVQMTQKTADLLKNYLQNHWRENPLDLLFPNRNNRPMKRAYVVKFGLWPILRELGLPTKGVGLHAFRHGLGTALADNQESVKNIQKILRHSDIKSTLRYIHPNTDTQRRALESLQLVQFGD